MPGTALRATLETSNQQNRNSHPFAENIPEGDGKGEQPKAEVKHAGDYVRRVRMEKHAGGKQMAWRGSNIQRGGQGRPL